MSKFDKFAWGVGSLCIVGALVSLIVTGGISTYATYCALIGWFLAYNDSFLQRYFKNEGKDAK